MAMLPLPGVRHSDDAGAGRLHASLSTDALCRLAARQTDHFFADGHALPPDDLLPSARVAMARLEHCFSQVDNRYFFDGQRAVFDHLHGDQYAMWLYLLANYIAGPPSTYTMWASFYGSVPLWQGQVWGASSRFELVRRRQAAS